MARAVSAVLAVLASACGHPAPAAAPVDPAAMRRAETDLERYRALLAPGEATGRKVRATVREPVGGRVIDARGGLAVRRDAARLLLVGPAGGLALDVWVNETRGRMAIPAIDRVETETERDPRPGRPMSFLRFWLLHPLDGKLVHADAETFTLRARDGATVTVRPLGETSLSLVRERGGDVERVSIEGAPCGTARYESEKSGVSVTIVCEGTNDAPPSPNAFEEPR